MNTTKYVVMTQCYLLIYVGEFSVDEIDNIATAIILLQLENDIKHYRQSIINGYETYKYLDLLSGAMTKVFELAQVEVS